MRGWTWKLLIVIGILPLSGGNLWAQNPHNPIPCGQQLSPQAVYRGVPAYSNGTDQWSEADCGESPGPYGDQYQCVEYVRRFYSLVFGVDTNKWKYYNADQYYENAATLGLLAFPNGGSVPPAPGDIVVFEGGSAGHVAIVMDLTSDGMDIIEQNWSVTGVAHLTLDSNGEYIRQNSHYKVLGWLRTSLTTYAFVANGAGPNDDVWSYRVDPITGALDPVTNPLTGSPGFTSSSADPGSISITADPTGRFVYLANLGIPSSSGDISAYGVDPATGVLAAIDGSPFSAGSGPISVAVHPSGKFVYVANEIGGEVSVFAANSTTGTLSQISGSPFTLSVAQIAMDPQGRFLFGAVPDLKAFQIDPVTGVPSQVASYSESLGPTRAAVDPTGKFLYVANFSGGVSAYTINSSTGVLTPISGSPFSGALVGFAVAIDPTGKFAYVANANPSDSISAYAIDSGTGALTSIGSPYPTAGCPVSVAVDPSGRFLYAAETCGSNNILGYQINPLSGALTPVTGSPFPTGSDPTSITVSQDVP